MRKLDTPKDTHKWLMGNPSPTLPKYLFYTHTHKNIKKKKTRRRRKKGKWWNGCKRPHMLAFLEDCLYLPSNVSFLKVFVFIVKPSLSKEKCH